MVADIGIPINRGSLKRAKEYLNSNRPILADSHLHLDMAEFDQDREKVIAGAEQAGVPILVQAGVDLESVKFSQQLARAYPNIYYIAGLHPHQADLGSDSYLQELKQFTSDPKCVAIGEVGLDYHYDFSPRSVQQRVFSAQIKLAQELDKPLVVHSREAFADTMIALTKAGIPRQGVLFHSFTGSESEAEELKRMGAFISVNGIITFPKAEKLRQTVASFPTDRIMLETDAPYLAPVPRRGRRNQPEYLPYINNALAELTGVTDKDIAYISTLATRQFFKIPYQDTGTISYVIGNNLYLNITNRCNHQCTFCLRHRCQGVGGYNLRLSCEPLASEVISAIGNPKRYDQVVFCGFGEPLLRAQLVLEVAQWIKRQGGRTRINTNGTISKYDGYDLTAELAGLVDTYSVSLNAVNAEEYTCICQPDTPNSFEAVLAFIRRVKELGASVVVTFVDRPGLDVASAERLAGQLGVEFRLRKYYNDDK